MAHRGRRQEASGPPHETYDGCYDPQHMKQPPPGKRGGHWWSLWYGTQLFPSHTGADCGHPPGGGGAADAVGANNSPRAVTAAARPTLAICFLIHFPNLLVSPQNRVGRQTAPLSGCCAEVAPTIVSPTTTAAALSDLDTIITTSLGVADGRDRPTAAARRLSNQQMFVRSSDNGLWQSAARARAANGSSDEASKTPLPARRPEG
jgi:hypothetical protein